MGSCLCLSKSEVLQDPDIPHAEAIHVTTVLSSNYAHDDTQAVMLFIKNNKLYHSHTNCGFLCCGFSSKLSDIQDVEVVAGKVRLNTFNNLQERVVREYHIDHGLKITFSKWRSALTAYRSVSVVKIYAVPDAVNFATQMQPHVSGRVTTQPKQCTNSGSQIACLSEPLV